MLKPAIVTTTRENFEILQKFINYHNSIGFENFYFFIDFYPYKLSYGAKSLDDATMEYSIAPLYNSEEEYFKAKNERLEIANKLKNISGVKVFFCDENFHETHYNIPVDILERQRRHADYAAILAFADGCTHLAHLDYDELIYSKSDLFLGQLKKIKSVAYMQALEAVPTTHDLKIFESNIFRKKLNADQQKLIEDNHFTEKFKTTWFRGYKHYKTIYNLEFLTKNKINIGIHTAKQNIPFEQRDNVDLNVLHYFCYNSDCFKDKWSLRAKDAPLWTYGCDQKSKDECKAFMACKNQEEIKSLYKEYYCLTSEQKDFLIKIGALVEININQGLFNNTTPGAVLRKRYLPKLKNSHLDLYTDIEDFVVVENAIIDPASCLVFDQNFEPHKQASLEYLWWKPSHFVTKDFKHILTRPVPRELVNETTKKREVCLNEYIQKIKFQEVVELPEENYVSLLSQDGWYAFGHIFDFLQKIYILKKLNLFSENINYLISDHSRITNFSLYLDILSGVPKTPHTTLCRDNKLRFVKKCILIKPQHWPQNFVDLEAYNFIYNSFCNYFKNHIPVKQKEAKLFLTRNLPVKRNILNFDTLYRALKENNISVLYGNEDLADIFYYFNNATHICGYHGSLFANHIFCKEGTKILEYCARNRPDASISDKWRNTELYYQKYVEADSKYDTVLDIKEILNFYK